MGAATISSTIAGAPPTRSATIRARSISCPSSPRSAPPAGRRAAASMPARPMAPSPWTRINGSESNRCGGAMTGIVRAPDFDQPGLAWFNVAAPLTLADLRGKLVILDFWTFCCINCMHILPSLRLVEEAFPDEVVVIGVHSPKFAAERAPANVAAAIARYGIVHPVIHDPDFRLWREYAVRAWPTLIFVSPDGRVIGQHSGEPDPDRLLEAVGATLAQWREEGLLRPSTLTVTPLAVPSGRL